MNTGPSRAPLPRGGFPAVTGDGTEIAPGVWLASAVRAELGEPAVLAADLADARTRPRWRRAEFLA
ncbi:hypothetical protein, partial [Amycolatopsis vancoresmycina]